MADVDGVDAAGARVEQRLREPAGGCPDVERDAVADVERERCERGAELALAPKRRRLRDDDRGAVAHERAGIADWKPVDEDATIADQTLRIRKVRTAAVQLGDERLPASARHARPMSTCWPVKPLAADGR